MISMAYDLAKTSMAAFMEVSGANPVAVPENKPIRGHGLSAEVPIGMVA